MRPFFAIFGVTIRQIARSHFSRVLVFLLFCWSLAIPLVVADGNALDFLRVALLYSTGGIHLFLGCGAVWLGCFAVASDVESGKIAAVAVKPVSRITVFTAKYAAVATLMLTLLALAEALVFTLVCARFSCGNFSAAEKERIRNEVMVGRRVYLPTRPDYGSAAAKKFRQRLEELRQAGNSVDLTDVIHLKQSVLEEVMAKDSEMRFGYPKEWFFSGLPAGRTAPLALRYRLYVRQISGENQRPTRLLWLAGMPRQSAGQGRESFDALPLSPIPEQLQGGAFTERLIPADAIAPSGELRLYAVNADDEKAALFITPADGPKLLIPVCSFAGNFCRMTLVNAIAVLILAALGCAFASFLSLPTAVFLSAGYLLAGALSSLWSVQTYFSGFFDEFGYHLAKFLLFFIVPLQSFDATALVSDGELVEFSEIARLFFRYGICRTLPVFLFGALIYRKRELAQAVKR